MLQKIVCLSYPPLLTLPTTTSPPFVNLTSYATGSGRRTLEPLPVLFAKAWQNCEYSTRGGVLPRNYLPITAAIARSPCQLPSPPSLLSLIPPHLSSISRRMRQDQGGGCEASAGAICNARAELSVFGKGGVLQKIVCLSYPPSLTLPAIPQPLLSQSRILRGRLSVEDIGASVGAVCNGLAKL